MGFVSAYAELRGIDLGWFLHRAETDLGWFPHGSGVCRWDPKIWLLELKIEPIDCISRDLLIFDGFGMGQFWGTVGHFWSILGGDLARKRFRGVSGWAPCGNDLGRFPHRAETPQPTKNTKSSGPFTVRCWPAGGPMVDRWVPAGGPLTARWLPEMTSSRMVHISAW